MRYALVIILVMSLVLTGCASVKTYTFQKDRVDQRMQGNRGYIMGTPPPAPVEKEVPKRTLIGIDVEIPILPYEETGKPVKKEREVQVEKVGTAPGRVGEDTVTMAPASPEPARGTVVQPKETIIIEEEVEEVEEEWIK